MSTEYVTFMKIDEIATKVLSVTKDEKFKGHYLIQGPCYKAYAIVDGDFVRVGFYTRETTPEAVGKLVKNLCLVAED